MKRFRNLPAVQSALDFIRDQSGLILDTRTFLQKREDREIAANYDVDKALKEALAARASLKNIPDEPNKL